MGTSYLQLESGVILAQQGSGYAEIRAALKRHDQSLELGGVVDPRYGKTCWKVYHRYGGESHQVHFLCDWRDPEGAPQDLSMGLVDKVASLDRNSRERPPSADELERKREDELAKRRSEIAEVLADDFRRPTISAALPRTANPGNHRWKEAERRKQQARQRKGLSY